MGVGDGCRSTVLGSYDDDGIDCSEWIGRVVVPGRACRRGEKWLSHE